MTATPHTTVTVPDLVGMLPEMLGFHPTESVVLTGLTHAGGWTMTARYDRDHLVPLTPGALDVCLQRMRERQTRHVLVVTYEREDTAETLAPLTRALTEAGLSLLDVGCAADGHWQSLATGERTALPSTDAVPAYSREALEASLAPMGAPALAAALDAAQTPAGSAIAPAVEAWAGMLTGRVEPTDTALTVALPLLRDVNYRDALIVTVTADPSITAADLIPAEHAERMTQTLPMPVTRTECTALHAVCRATPPRHAPDVLAIAGLCHLTAGSGAHATMLAEHAQRIDPGHALSGLVARMAELGISPTHKAP